MHSYLELCRKALDTGVMKENRTGTNHIGYQGDMCKYDMADGFPAVTTKRLASKACFSEMLGFFRGYDNASEFRRLGCKVWDANANENEQWMLNPNRKGIDDLGRVYGVQWRKWKKFKVLKNRLGYTTTVSESSIDQLRNVYDDLRQGKDNRREIVIGWNPAELDQMALPPCHMMMQFGIQDGKLNLGMYQRSCDLPLGIPFNIAGYSWLLHVMARITGLEPGVFTHFMWDIHVYANQMQLLEGQIDRVPFDLPTLWMNPHIRTFEDMEDWVTVDDFKLEGYKHHPSISYPFSC